MDKKNDKTVKAQKKAEDAAQQDVQQPVQEELKLSQEEFEKLKAHIETLQKDKDDAVSTAQRLQAEFDNYRKRNATLRADSYDEGKRDCMRAMLPTLDNFDRALENAAQVDKAFVDGIVLVQRTMVEALQKLGMKEIDASGSFDANVHHAVLQEKAEGVQSGDILEVFQKGYEADEKILRHAMVKVAE